MPWLVALLLIMLQSLLTPLLAPFAPPDFFLLTALFSLGSRRLPQALLLAYGLGALQDVSGSGLLGLHALGLAAGVFCGAGATPREGFLRGGLPRQLITICIAWVGKWLAFTLLLLYLGRGQPLSSTAQTAGLELVFTLLAAALLHPLLNLLTRRRERTFYL